LTELLELCEIPSEKESVMTVGKVLLLYASDDKDVVEKHVWPYLARELPNVQFSTFDNYYPFIGGKLVVYALRDVIEKIDKVVVFLSKAFLTKPLKPMLARMADEELKLIPVSLEACASPYKPKIHLSAGVTGWELGNLVYAIAGNNQFSNSQNTTPYLLHNRYRIDRQIKAGAMGSVHLGLDTVLNKEIAIKRVTDVTDAKALAAFEQEAQILAGLRHQYLPAVSDYFVEKGIPYLIMDYVSGQDLETRMQSDSFTLGQLLNWLDMLLEVLEYLHGQYPPVVHRDIKPANIIITSENIPVLTDFGSAKGRALETQRAGGRTVFSLTTAYASFEQQQGQGTDPRSDLYSIAATFYELLSGDPPADASIRAGAVFSKRNDPFKPLSLTNSKYTLSAHIDAAFTWALALFQDDRIPDAKTFRQALRGPINTNPNTSNIGAKPVYPSSTAP
jgi:tRNA A-37 threonylcarbamoyl transferase component Bud32